MSSYIEILSIQRPFSGPGMVDENNRAIFSANYRALAAAPVISWEREIAKLISDNGLGTLGVDLFIGPKAVLPTTGTLTLILDTGGTEPSQTHNGATYERLSCQITVRAEDYDIAASRALSIWRALDGRRNFSVTA